jgi:hypothetical protein
MPNLQGLVHYPLAPLQQLGSAAACHATVTAGRAALLAVQCGMRAAGQMLCALSRMMQRCRVSDGCLPSG